MNHVHFGPNLRSNGRSCPELYISPYAKSVRIGSHFTFGNFSDAGWSSCCSIYVKAGATLNIGDHSGINGVLLYCSNSISIGNYVKIGGGTRVFDTDFHPLDTLHRRVSNKGTHSKPIIIEDDVFIGTACIVGKGIHIGKGSIIAAGSVVVKDVPAGEVWGGNPAVFIRKNQS